MRCRKLNLWGISNTASRRATFNKRCQGLIKKASELATVCGVRVCILVCGKNEVQPEVWASIPEARNFLASYKATAEVTQWNRKTSHGDFLKKRIAKLQDQVRKFDHERQGHETSILFQEALAGRRPGLVGVTPEEVLHLLEVVEKKMKVVQERLQRLGIEPEQPQQQLPHAWSMIQPQVPYTFTKMHGQAPVEEPQRHQQDMLTDMVRYGMEPGAIVSGAIAWNRSSAEPSTASTSHGPCDIVQPYNQGGWPWNQIPAMARGLKRLLWS